MLKCRLNVVLFFLALACLKAHAASGEIKKVLPHYLDEQGRHTLAPSLYERDAYQAHLRKNPAKRAALRFDVNWKASGNSKLKLRLELRGSLYKSAQPLVLEADVEPPRLFTRWSSITLEGDACKQFGELIAWRATLWHGDTMLDEQTSFLW